MPALLLSLLATMPAASNSAERGAAGAGNGPVTTYEKFLPLGVAGDPDIQHMLGYMFFYGEGVEPDYDEAHYWFHLAAEEGDLRAQRNLAIMHARSIDRVPAKFYDAAEANLWFSLVAANPENPAFSEVAAKSHNLFTSLHSDKDLRRIREGQAAKNVYRGLCAGCHGFDGFSAYSGAPSFAHGERLDRTDEALLASILYGRGKMPGWEKAMSTETAATVLSYIRQAFRPGAGQPARAVSQQAAPVDDELVLGEQVYLGFCGGCHGFNGIAWYVNSPSFALGQRMDKTDTELKRTIEKGKGEMPSWEDMLRPGQIDALVRFIRTLAPSYESGLKDEVRHPGQFLRFRPRGRVTNNWTGDDVR